MPADSLNFSDLSSPREVNAYAVGNVQGILGWDRPAEFKLAAIQRVMAEAEQALERLKEQETE